jgi:hypothetical protein
MKLLFTLLLGAALGYIFGFKDAQTHEKNIFARSTSSAVGKVGGSNRKNMDGDLDGRMERAAKQ